VTAPLVSVIMASYNAETFIGEAIESVLNQTYQPLELVVVDDCSSDATPEVVSGYAQREPARVRLHRKKIREGPCRARNCALGLTHGPLVCWLDNDDVWLPTKVADQVAALSDRPEVGLVYTYFDAFDSDTGEFIPWPDGRRTQQGNVLGDLLLLGCFIGSSTAMFRREVLDLREIQLRQRDFSIGDDYYLWLTISLDWQIAHVPRVLARYRRHSANESSRVVADVDFARWRASLVREFLDEFPEATRRLQRSDRAAVARYLLRSACNELKGGNLSTAGREARVATHLGVSTMRP
jgi:glycosyltransferase involved in cell wall biosynthesis